MFPLYLLLSVEFITSDWLNPNETEAWNIANWNGPNITSKFNDKPYYENNFENLKANFSSCWFKVYTFKTPKYVSHIRSIRSV